MSQQWQERVKAVLESVDQSSTPPALYVMGMASDVQELLTRGMTEQATETLNNMKIIIDHRLSTKDEFGRHI